jgi:hypothetical protein
MGGEFAGLDPIIAKYGRTVHEGIVTAPGPFAS